jgi:hypothetical protein
MSLSNVCYCPLLLSQALEDHKVGGAKILKFPVRWMPVQVRTYSGYKSDEYPMELRISHRWSKINQILDRWYEPGANYFKVETEGGGVLLLRQDLESDAWSIKPIHGTRSDCSGPFEGPG